MSITKRVEDVLDQVPAMAREPELARLRAFFEEMKEAGVARTPEYDLPLPDTLGRSGSTRFSDSRRGNPYPRRAPARNE